MQVFDFNVPQIKICDYRPNNGDYRIFNDIYELFEFVNRFDTKGCFFRGQAGLWDIVSSLYRHAGTDNWEKATNTCDIIYRCLKGNMRLKTILDDDDKILAVAQHYGCPTDLVDITSDIKTAAYFATENDGKNTGEALANSNGCIWVFSQGDFNLINSIIKVELNSDSRGTFDNLPIELKDRLSKNSNLLIKHEIPQLSRLNAQKGCFLWDICGILRSLIVKNHVGVRLEFKHCDNEHNQFKIDKKRLFPLPNQLESEIMSVMSESSRKNGLPNYRGIVNIVEVERTKKRINGLPPEIAEKVTDVIEVPSPDYFVPSCSPYIWERKPITETNYCFNFIDKHNCKMFQLFKLSTTDVLPIVEAVLEELNDNNVTDLLVLLVDLTQAFEERRLYAFENEMFFVEPIITMKNYYYNSQEIAEVICNMMDIVVFLCKAKQNKDNVAITFKNFLEESFSYNVVIDMLTNYYDSEVTNLTLCESFNFSNFCLPTTYQILDDVCQDEFNRYIPKKDLLPKLFQNLVENLPDNAKVFAYQSDPRKIMSYEKAKRLFIDFILPQQFLFHQNSRRINFPDYLSVIKPPFMGRNHMVINNTGKVIDEILNKPPIELTF